MIIKVYNVFTLDLASYKCFMSQETAGIAATIGSTSTRSGDEETTLQIGSHRADRSAEVQFDSSSSSNESDS